MNKIVIFLTKQLKIVRTVSDHSIFCGDLHIEGINYMFVKCTPKSELFASDKVKFKSSRVVVLNQRRFCLSWDHRQDVETFLVVTVGGGSMLSASSG